MYAIGEVLDAHRGPQPHVYVKWSVWANGDTTAWRREGGAYTDSLGQFAVKLGDLTSGRIDSVTVNVARQLCAANAPFHAAWRNLAVEAQPVDTLVRATLLVDDAYPRARLEPGPACAVGEAVISGFLSRMWLMLRITEVGDSVRGRWRTNYQMTRTDEYGDFAGARSGDTLVLELSNAKPWFTEWDSCTNFVLAIPVEPGEVLGDGRFVSGDCPRMPVGFHLVASDELDWLLMQEPG